MGTAIAAAAFGDLVCGLAAVSPPASFVGELGSAADRAAQSLIGGLLRSAGAAVPVQPKVRINGRTVGTTAVGAAAIPASPTPGIAHLPVGSGLARVGGDALTLHGAAAFLQPTSALRDLGGGQSVLRLHGGGASEPSRGALAGLDQLRKSIPRRQSFEPRSALHELISRCSPERRLDLAPAAYEVLVGDPVNVVTGAVISDATDYEQPWPALRFARRYDSRRSDRASALGHGWTHALDQAVRVEPGRVVLREGDGREREFDTLHLPGRVCRAGDVLHDPTERFRLRCVGSQQWELHDGHAVRQFAAVPDEPEPAGGRARLLRMALRDGVVIECGYAAGRLAEVRADNSPVLRLEHDERGLLRRLYSVAAGGELLEASYHYSSDDTLLRVIGPDGLERRYEYAGRLLVQEKNRDGGCFYYGYDGVGAHARCVRTWGDGGRLDRAIEHEPTEGRTTVRDGLGQQTTYRYDAAGLVTEITREGGLRHTYRYDAQLRLVEVRWPDGTTQTAAYDDAGQLVRRTERDGSSWAMAYDAHGRLAEGIDPAGGRWRFHHDERGRLRELMDPCGRPTRLDFDRGECRVIDATGHRVVLGLDAQQRVTELPAASDDASGERLRFSYDPQGRLARAWLPGGAQARWSYDRSGRPCRFQSASTGVDWRRSGEGKLVEVEHDGRRARIARDPFGVIRAIEAAGRTTRYAYDREGRLLTVHEGERLLLRLARDASGRVLAYDAADLGRCELRRGADHGRITRLRWAGDAIELEWDAAGRLTRVQRGPERVSTYAYRADGYLMAATNEHITVAFERDARGAVLQQRWGALVVSDAFPDHRGRRSGLRLGERLRVSYLRGPQGDVERIAVLLGPGHEPLELRPGHGPQGDPPPLPALDPDAVDPLWRPLSPRGPEHLVWDEDRCLARENTVFVHHPEDAGPSFVIDGEGCVTTTADHAGALAPHTEASALDRAHAAAFPRVGPSLADSLPTPTAGLHALLGHRAWAPHARPVPGTTPWDPQAWEAQVHEPAIETGRLTARALLQALGSPFPRPELAIER